MTGMGERGRIGRGGWPEGWPKHKKPQMRRNLKMLMDYNFDLFLDLSAVSYPGTGWLF